MTRGAGAGSATEAVASGMDGAVFKGVGVELPKITALVVFQRKVQHLVEIAVKDFSGIGDIERVATHEAINGVGIEVFEQQVVVIF